MVGPRKTGAFQPNHPVEPGNISFTKKYFSLQNYLIPPKAQKYTEIRVKRMNVSS